MNNNLINPFDAQTERARKLELTARLSSKVTKIFTPKPYFERWYFFNVLCSLGGYFCQLVSPLTALCVLFFFFLDILFPLVGAFAGSVLSLVFGGALCLLIEIQKRVSTNNCLVNWFNYRKLGLAFGVALLCSIVSVSFSFYGAYTLPQRVSTPPALLSPRLVDTQRVSAHYLALIESKKDAISDKKGELSGFEKNNQSTSAPRLSRRKSVTRRHETLSSQLHTLEGELSQLQKDYTTALSDATKDNKLMVRESKEEHEKESALFERQTLEKGRLLGWVSLGFEGLFWLFLLFNFYYYKRSQRELIQLSPALTNQKEQLNNQSDKTPANTSLQRLYNGCKVTKDDKGKALLVYNGQSYSLERLRNNYHANKSKAKKYESAGDSQKAHKYTQSSQHWESLISVLQSQESPVSVNLQAN